MSDFYEDLQLGKDCLQLEFDLKERQIHTLKSLYNGHDTDSFPTFKARNIAAILSSARDIRVVPIAPC